MLTSVGHTFDTPGHPSGDTTGAPVAAPIMGSTPRPGAEHAVPSVVGKMAHGRSHRAAPPPGARRRRAGRATRPGCPPQGVRRAVVAQKGRSPRTGPGGAILSPTLRAGEGHDAVFPHGLDNPSAQRRANRPAGESPA